MRYLFVLIPWSLTMYFIYLSVIDSDPIVGMAVYFALTILAGLVVSEKS